MAVFLYPQEPNMTDKSKWFVYELENGQEFGCFRIKPYNSPACAAALRDLIVKKTIFKMSEFKFAQEYMRIIAKHVIQDWENVVFITSAGEVEGETPYSPENAYQLLMHSDPDMNLASWIVEKAKSIT